MPAFLFSYERGFLFTIFLFDFLDIFHSQICLLRWIQRFVLNKIFLPIVFYGSLISNNLCGKSKLSFEKVIFSLKFASKNNPTIYLYLQFFFVEKYIFFLFFKSFFLIITEQEQIALDFLIPFLSPTIHFSYNHQV